MGANIADLIAGIQFASSPETPIRILSGSIQSGREAAFVGRYHQQVSIIDAPKLKPKSPPRGPLKRLRNGQNIRPIIAVASLNGALPFDIPAVPLMRALSIGDIDAAEKLGCLELIEEDVAHLSQICTSGADYGRLLRHVLNELDTVS
jgi:Na+-transporting NADH:ubiquinone oxidoreductase subunit A